MHQIKIALEGKFAKLEKLSEYDQLTLFYHKCKTNVTVNSLSVIYDATPEYISQAFDSVEEILFEFASKNIWFLS